MDHLHRTCPGATARTIVAVPHQLHICLIDVSIQISPADTRDQSAPAVPYSFGSGIDSRQLRGPLSEHKPILPTRMVGFPGITESGRKQSRSGPLRSTTSSAFSLQTAPAAPMFSGGR